MDRTPSIADRRPGSAAPAAEAPPSADDLVLLVEADPDEAVLVQAELEAAGIAVERASSGPDGLALLASGAVAVALLDTRLPVVRGRNLLARIRREQPGLPVVMLTAEDDRDTPAACMADDAADYVCRPFDRRRLITSVRNALGLARLRRRVARLADDLHGGDRFGAFVGDADGLCSALALLRRAAGSDVTVLLAGESGTGKAMAARALHAQGRRRWGPFVEVDCGALSPDRTGLELLGRERGAAAAGDPVRLGAFERAHGGTLLLQHVGALSSKGQDLLLEVLEHGTVTREGGRSARSVDVRVLVASEGDLRAAAGLRDDLYYRLALFPVELPPLRSRPGDVPVLAEHFLQRAARWYDLPVRGFSAAARRALLAHVWPGNVRELERVVVRAVLIEERELVSLSSLPDQVVAAAFPEDSAAPSGHGPACAHAARSVRSWAEQEREILERALLATEGDLAHAARHLGLGRAAIQRLLERHGLEPECSE